VPDYLVEVYMGRRHAHELTHVAVRARQAAEALTAAGTIVHYLGSIAVPEDEMCFHFYTGPTAAVVSDAASRAAITVDRVVEAVHLNPYETAPRLGRGDATLS
jgi:hypothetical protein